jgi:hypothetical protein
MKAVAVLCLLGIVSLSATAQVGPIPLRDDQYFVVDGISLREFAAFVDCSQRTIDWGALSSTIPPVSAGRIKYLPGDDWSFVGHPRNSSAMSGEQLTAAMDSCKQLESIYYDKVHDMCATSRDNRELQQMIDYENSQPRFRSVASDIEISDLGFVHFRFHSAPHSLIGLDPEWERMNRSLPITDPCETWETMATGAAEYFSQPVDGWIRVVYVSGMGYGYGWYKTQEEMCENLSRLFPALELCAGVGCGR